MKPLETTMTNETYKTEDKHRGSGSELSGLVMLEEQSIEEFRDAGLLLLTNQFLHIFGWALTVNIDENGKITKFYPAHCKFRGFDNKNTSEAYEKITLHLAERMPELLKDIEA